MYIYAYIYVYMYICKFVNMYICSYVCTYVYMYICKYVYIYVYMHISISAYIHTYDNRNNDQPSSPFSVGWPGTTMWRERDWPSLWGSRKPQKHHCGALRLGRDENLLCPKWCGHGGSESPVKDPWCSKIDELWFFQPLKRRRNCSVLWNPQKTRCWNS